MTCGRWKWLYNDTFHSVQGIKTGAYNDLVEDVFSVLYIFVLETDFWFLVVKSSPNAGDCEGLGIADACRTMADVASDFGMTLQLVGKKCHENVRCLYVKHGSEIQAVAFQNIPKPSWICGSQIHHCSEGCKSNKLGTFWRRGPQHHWLSMKKLVLAPSFRFHHWHSPELFFWITSHSSGETWWNHVKPLSIRGRISDLRRGVVWWTGRLRLGLREMCFL